MPLDPQFVVQVLLVVGGSTVLATLVRGLFQRKQVNADAAAVLARTSADLLGPLREQVTQLVADLNHERSMVAQLRADLYQTRDELENCRRELRAAQSEARQLRRQIGALKRDADDLDPG